jgi:hypothetical protein
MKALPILKGYIGESDCEKFFGVEPGNWKTFLNNTIVEIPFEEKGIIRDTFANWKDRLFSKHK